jgi:hypothetical protein
MAVFQSFWYGDSLPRHAMLSIKSFLDHGHDYHLYMYTPFDLPDGAHALDARDVLPSDRVFFYKQQDGERGSVAAFSNLFRYEVLRANGNWWVDTDVVCLARSVPDAETFWGWESDDRICTAILKVPPDYHLIEQAARESQTAGSELSWGQTGPVLITRLVLELGLDHLSSPRDCAYPINWSEHRLPVTAGGFHTSCSRLRGRPFLHLWHEMFRRGRDESINEPEPGSFLRMLYTRHLDGK